MDAIRGSRHKITGNLAISTKKPSSQLFSRIRHFFENLMEKKHWIRMLNLWAFCMMSREKQEYQFSIPTTLSYKISTISMSWCPSRKKSIDTNKMNNYSEEAKPIEAKSCVSVASALNTTIAFPNNTITLKWIPQRTRSTFSIKFSTDIQRKERIFFTWSISWTSQAAFSSRSLKNWSSNSTNSLWWSINLISSTNATSALIA